MIVQRSRLFALTFPMLAVAAYSGLAAAPARAAGSRAQLVADARLALAALYAASPKAKALAPRASAILLFPGVLKGGLVIGAAGGDGVLFSPDGAVLGYYNVTAISYGLQAGAQDFSEAMLLMTRGAVEYLNRSEGLSVGTGPSVALIDQGAGADMSSTTLRSDIYAFVYGQRGLMAGIGVQGQKITKLSA